MATKKEKAQLIDRIKHGIKKYKFSIGRYGGETVLGTITAYQYHYWKDRENELTDYLMGFNREAYEAENCVPEEAKMRDWFEIDNVAHVCGAPVESGNCLHVEESDQNGVPIKDANGHYKFLDPIGLDNDSREKLGIQLEDGECIDVDHPSLENQYYFWGSTSNKGSWSTDEEIEIDGDLDFSQLKIHYKQIEGSDIAYGISYANGELKYLQEDSSGSSQQCMVLEGNMNQNTMSKKLKKEIAQAEFESSKALLELIDRASAGEEPIPTMKEHVDSHTAGKKKKNKVKKKIKTKKIVKGKKSTKKKKEKK
jgi:hypothetical protein